ncbi:MAG: hypothetical protein ACRCS9_12580, partial [Hyphomicrobium sp.]
MKFMKLCVVAASMAFAGLATTAASAAPIGVAKSAVAGTNTMTETVHYRHNDCRRGPNGWHRSTRYGRQACGRSNVNPAVPLALWIWRCADGRCGYWHRNERRWRDGRGR